MLDSFEHLLDAVELLAALTQRAPGVKVLTTSRERLNLQGEWVVGIEGLSFSDSVGKTSSVVRSPSSAGEIESYAAVQLFLQSARRANSSFLPGDEDWPVIAQICKLVDGLPLAIELAAAWLPVLSAGEIAHEIGVNLDFLATQLRDVPQRHHSMRAVFDHSWNLLLEEERDLFLRLSVFRGGFRREAAEQSAGAALPLLSALVAKSFLRRSPRGVTRSTNCFASMPTANSRRCPLRVLRRGTATPAITRALCKHVRKGCAVKVSTLRWRK